MTGLKDLVISAADDIGFERFEAAYEIEERNRIGMEVAAINTYNAKQLNARINLDSEYPMHKDILVNDDGDPVAWFNFPNELLLYGEWKFDTQVGKAETNGGMLTKQQYYDRESGVAEWVSVV